MSRKNRIEYLVCTMCVLITGFIIYGLVGYVTPDLNVPLIHNSKIQSFFLLGCLGGLVFSMALSGIILTVRFISKRSLKFKIIASVFWIITFACTFYVGVLAYFPYQIYNLVKIIKDSDDKEVLSESSMS